MNKWLLIHSVGGEGLVCAGEGLGSLSSMHGLWGMRLGAVRIIKGRVWGICVFGASTGSSYLNRTPCGCSPVLTDRRGITIIHEYCDSL